MDEVPPRLSAEVARLLKEAGVRQIDLVKAGIGTATARRLLAGAPGSLSIKAADEAMRLLGRELWHRKRARK